jgi:hypothetical protein
MAKDDGIDLADNSIIEKQTIRNILWFGIKEMVT